MEASAEHHLDLPVTDVKYASFSRRMWAATVDSLLIGLVAAPLCSALVDYFYGGPAGSIDMLALVQRMGEQTGTLAALQAYWQAAEEAGIAQRFWPNTLLQTGVFVAALAVCWRLWSSSPGKRLFKTKIVDAGSGAPISDRQIILRLIGYFISALPLFLGFFWISWNRKRQGWHDLIANTVVVVTPDPAAARR